MADKRDYYEVLGVDRNASDDDLRKAFRREAMKHHPDRNPGNAEAEALYKEANEAYQVLSDGEKRRVYDQFGHAGLEGGGGAGAPGDIFSHMQDLFQEMFSGAGFGGGGGRGRRAQRGADLRVEATLSLREAVYGCKREIDVRAPSPCVECSGSGAKAGTRPEVCVGCRGTGQVSTQRGFVMFSSACARCAGTGQVIKAPCAACRGQGAVEKSRKVTVTFPAGIDNGQRLRVSGQGVHPGGGLQPGDLYVDVEVGEDPRFERDGVDLITRLEVSFPTMVTGGAVHVPTLEESGEGSTTLEIPVGTAPGTVFSMRGRGVPRLDGRGRGNLVIVAQVAVPKAVSGKARELLMALEVELAKES
jgi:molecular chaperone DnaJ